LLAAHLRPLESLDEAIEHVSGDIAQRLTAAQETIALLDTILGVGQRGCNAHRGDRH
jgi:hypothetical protein